MALTPEEVRAAWRVLTDEPVPDDWLIRELCVLPSLRDLRRMIVATEAFQRELPNFNARMPLTVPPLAVESAADPQTLAALLTVVRDQWQRVGVDRPHWSVTGRDEFLPDRLRANRDAFDSSGEEELALILAILERNGSRRESFGHVCDFGCGVGRVSLPLARRFARVTGCDVSEAHLRVAREDAAAAGVANITFVRVDPPDIGMTEPIDLWFSHLVLQHNPPPIMAAILRRMFRLLTPGGAALFQIPTYLRGYSFDTAAYLRSPPDNPMQIHALPQSAVLALAREASCDVLEIREDNSVWPPSEAVSNVMLFRKPPHG
jgi:2-polyprenyl-3-methyl-5-hydroxy-6-metoxy-1,4-benzoquinol methylase